MKPSRLSISGAGPRLKLSGAGLGLRREMLPQLLERVPEPIGFFEVAPENWMEMGGRFGRQFRALTERYPFITHGLSLSLGSPAPLDTGFVRRVKQFLDAHGIRYYSEHLSYCSDDGHLYDLMPIPFTEDAVKHVASRIRRVQDILEREIAVENVSYYAAPGAEMTELEFLNAVLERADCGLLLDVNNVYVNSINHRYDAAAFLEGVPADRVRYLHVAGHYVEAEELRVDTHGADVIDPVWALLDRTYARLGPVPTLLERDFNIPPLDVLVCEVERVRNLQQKRPVGAPLGATVAAKAAPTAQRRRA
ncbi:MAG: HvfB family MNIO-type RiPP peptide maturase [Nevskiaceae bacterium]